MFGCIYVSDFPVQAALLCEARLYLAEAVAGEGTSAERSLAIHKSLIHKSLIQKSFNNHQIAVLDGPANQMKVFACNGPARKAGIEIGMTKIQAEALPTVALRKRVLDHEFRSEERRVG